VFCKGLESMGGYPMHEIRHVLIFTTTKALGKRIPDVMKPLVEGYTTWASMGKGSAPNEH